MNEPYHIPVLLKESVDLLDINPRGIYVDVTFGGGGHSREILSRLGKRGRLIAFDQDKDAFRNAPDDARFTLIHNNFKFVRGCVKALGFDSVDGILADLGVSSHHFDTAERGFSFRFNAPLDMRMNQEASVTAAHIVNNYSVEALATVFGKYGELDRPMRLAYDIIKYRETAPINTISDLQKSLERSTPKFSASKFYAKLFQSLRIEVNSEMIALEMMLYGSFNLLREGGILSVITYHSLEDRMVKNFMRSGNIEGVIDKDFYGNILTPFELLSRKALEPTAFEINHNSRSRSAKLRGVRKK